MTLEAVEPIGEAGTALGAAPLTSVTLCDTKSFQEVSERTTRTAG